ncbi:DNA methylase N-4/N-6 [Paenibacillus sp. Leaf72]|nr:DNA methylase N-4/N-6 [Paenibacillus sp. Leaf72]
MNYPDRGKWGDTRYRGNCSGYVIRDLLEHFKPHQFHEIFAGGGTGYDVARELGYENSIHLDLNPRFGNWNALEDEMPEGSDFLFAHDPYHDIIKYSGNMWGKPHKDDLSRCPSYEDFLRKINHVHAKMYASLRKGGRMAILTGDIRRKGEYFSIARDMALIGKLDSWIIKTQHNCESNRKQYAGSFIPIVHEHLLIFRKDDLWFVPIKINQNFQQDLRESLKVTWRDLIQATFEQIGRAASLKELYEVIENTARAKKNQHWHEKIRQTLQINEEFSSVSRGVWRYTPKGKSLAI